MEVLLLRHGKTAGNAAGRYIGRTDVPVIEEGLEALRALGTDESVSRVYVTPLRRTHQTAAIFFPKAEQVIVDDLREMDFGDFEGRTADEMADDPDYRAWVAGGCVDSCPNGDNIESFTARIQRGFRTAVAMAMERGDKRLVIVGHGGSFMALMISFAHDGRGYFDWFAPNGGGWRARLDEAAWDDDPRLLEVVPVSGPNERPWASIEP